MSAEYPDWMKRSCRIRQVDGLKRKSVKLFVGIKVSNINKRSEIRKTKKVKVRLYRATKNTEMGN